jgi:molybdate transport system substrate-binding protein
LLFAAIALQLAACGDGGERVRVFAASSLTDVLPEAIERFREQHPGVEFEVSYAGSQTLATQIEEGAPVDLFLAADPVQPSRLEAAGLVERSAALVENRLVIAVDGNSSWRSVDDVVAADTRFATGAPDVPVRALTRTVLGLLDPTVAEQIRASIVTEDPNVRVALSRVELGEADAAFVYETDLAAAPGLRAILLPDEFPRNEYRAVLVAGGRTAPDSAAAAFFAFLLDGDGGQRILAEAGFIPIGAPVE